MFDNMLKEVLYYSLIPVAILAIITLLVFVFWRKREKNCYKYSYLVKILLAIMISLVLPLIIGHTIWRIKYVPTSDLWYIFILISLIISLTVLLVIICHRLYKSFDEKKSFS